MIFTSYSTSDMAELFNNITEIKDFVGGAINKSVEITSIAPVIYEAARRHVTPYLGDDFYTDLVEAHATSTMNAGQTALLPFVRRPLAMLMLYEYSKVASVEFGEGGMFRVETETRKTPFKYQENNYRNSMREKGYDALETLLRFLSDNVATYTDWAPTEEAAMHLDPLLNYAADFRRAIQVNCDRYSFETLRPIMAQVETFGIQNLLPSAFWTGFKERNKANTLTVAEKELRRLMRMAIGHRSLEEAVTRQWVQIKDGRLFVVEEYSEAADVNRTQPSQAIGAIKLTAHQEWADRHTAQWKKYMCDHVDDFESAFDEASGGTNTDSDAWHIATDDEVAAEAIARDERMKKPVVLL